MFGEAKLVRWEPGPAIKVGNADDETRAVGVDEVVRVCVDVLLCETFEGEP